MRALPQLADQAGNLGTGRDVERRGRLVGDQDVESSSASAMAIIARLPLAARQLVRIGLGDLRGCGKRIWPSRSTTFDWMSAGRSEV